MRYWLSDPKTEWVMGQVERRTDRHERAEPIEDRCAAIISFAGGARGILESDMPASDAPDVGMRIYGTEGTLKIDGTALYVQNADAAGFHQLDVPSDTNQFVELIRGLEGKNGHRNEAKHGRAVVEIMMAIYESLRTKGLVEGGFGAGPDETQADRDEELENCVTEDDLNVILDFTETSRKKLMHSKNYSD